MLVACVVAPGEISTSLRIGAPVFTAIEVPAFALLGADTIFGRAPLNRYDGEYNSMRLRPSRLLGPLSPPDSTRPSGSNNAVEWYARCNVCVASGVHVSAA